MCDDAAFDDMADYTLRNGGLSRRELGRLALGAGLAFALPRAANAVETTESEVEIKTPDGTADAYFVHPGAGKHPGVLIWPDIFGLRPAFRQMGKRLAEAGYACWSSIRSIARRRRPRRRSTRTSKTRRRASC